MSCDLDRSQPMSAVAALTQRAFGISTKSSSATRGNAKGRTRSDPHAGHSKSKRSGWQSYELVICSLGDRQLARIGGP